MMSHPSTITHVFPRVRMLRLFFYEVNLLFRLATVPGKNSVELAQPVSQKLFEARSRSDHTIGSLCPRTTLRLSSIIGDRALSLLGLVRKMDGPFGGGRV